MGSCANPGQVSCDRIGSLANLRVLSICRRVVAERRETIEIARVLRGWGWALGHDGLDTFISLPGLIAFVEV